MQHTPDKVVAGGHVELIEKPKNLWKDRSLVNIGPNLKGFPENQLATTPSIEGQCLRCTRSVRLDESYHSASGVGLPAGDFCVLDFGVNRTGFAGTSRLALRQLFYVAGGG